MASDKEYLEFVLEQLSGVGDIFHRAMMGEYIIYYKGKVIGGIYDNRFLVKNTPTARKMMPEAPAELPYEGGKEMLLVEEMENREFLAALLDAVFDELPNGKSKIKR